MSKLEDMLANAEVDIEFESAREEQLVRVAAQGLDAKEFLTTNPVGRYIVGAALIEQRDIESQLAKVAPWRKKRIADLQLKHRAIENALRWICEQVAVGRDAILQLEEPPE